MGDLPHCVRHVPPRSPRGPCKLFEAHGLRPMGFFRTSPYRRFPLSPGFARCGAPRTSLPACGGALQMKKENQRSSKLGADFLFSFAEREGFEPPDPLRSTVFKTAAFDHSAISPMFYQILEFGFQIMVSREMECKVRHFFVICNSFTKFSHSISIK